MQRTPQNVLHYGIVKTVNNKTLAHICVQFSTLIVIIISTRAVFFEKMTSLSQILEQDFEQGKLMADVNSRK